MGRGADNTAANAATVSSAPARGKRGLANLMDRGESLVASGGLFSAAILLGVMGAMAWWTLTSQTATVDAAQESRVRTVATLMGRGVEALLANNDIEGVRRLVESTARSEGLEAVRVTLEGVERAVPVGSAAPAGPGRMVIADAGGNAPTELRLPETWGASIDPTQCGRIDVSRGHDGAVRVSVQLWAPRRGPAIIEIEDVPSAEGWLATTWRLQVGLGAIGALGLVGTLLAYRRMRSRLRAVGAIRDALRSTRQGSASAAELAVSASFGPEAEAWNQLLAERESLRRQALAEKAAEGIGSRRGRDGELQSVCDAMWQGLLLVDDQMKVKYGNGAAAVFLAAKREGLTGSPLGTLIGDAKVLAAVEAVASGTVKNRTMVEVDRTQERAAAPSKGGGDDPAGQSGSSGGGGAGGILRYTIRPVRKEDTARALVVIEDVTQQRVADNARNSFVAQVTHELRTPLTNIRLYVDSLIEDGDTDPVRRATAINVISQEARRLERIVGDMLSVAEIEAGQMKLIVGDVRMDALFEEVKTDFSAQAESKEMKLTFDLPPKLPVLNGDRDKITLALHNLVGNALKYTPAGGEVTVRVLEEATQLRVDVSDNGIGIKPEEQELIFDKFYRAKDRRISGITGSGLGLALAREVARLHGGDVTVRSQVDKGSTFSLTLPALKAA